MSSTDFKIYDNTEIQDAPVEVEEYDDSPVILSPIFSSKGSEEFKVYGTDYFELTGDPNFAKYGQLSIQNANIIKQGGRIAGKRICLASASLANTALVAKIVTTESGEDEDKVTTHKVVFTAKSVPNAKTIQGIEESIDASISDENEFALFIAADTGRGESHKNFYFAPINRLSANESCMFYNVNVTEGGSIKESSKFAALPDTIRNNICYEIGEIADRYFNHMQFVALNDNIRKFIDALAVATGMDADEVASGDFLSCTTRDGAKWDNISVDYESGLNPFDSTGIALANGSYGEGGEAPIKNLTQYNADVLTFFSGTETPEIWDLRSLALTAVFDACFPVPVKNKIVELADYRMDFTFYGDFGNAITSLTDVEEMNAQVPKSWFATYAYMYYSIRDPYSFKKVQVSYTYDIASHIIKHLIDKASVPYAGIFNDAELFSCIRGTLNYMPLKNNEVDEEKALKKMHVNFAAYYGNRLMIESVFNSYDKYSEATYTCNILAVQRIIRTLRYTVISQRFRPFAVSNRSELDNITEYLNRAISIYASDFDSLSFAYEEDSISLDNRIYTGEIHVKFKKWFDSEVFKIYLDKAA